MRTPAWLKDVLFIGTCVAGVTALVLAFALQSRADLGPEAAPPRSAEHAREIADVAARVDAALALRHEAASLAPTDTVGPLLAARRLSLALTGTVPSLEEIRVLQSLEGDEGDDENARAWFVDYLLADRRFADYFAERLARPLVGVEDGSLIVYRRRRFVSWLSDQLAAGVGWDRITRQMLTGRGLWTQHPAANFVTAAVEPGAAVPREEVLATRVSRGLLGVRLDCAQCHDHPFDERWTQRDFQGLAAFFGRSKVTFTGVQEVRGEYEYADDATKADAAIAPAVPYRPERLPEDAAGGGDDRDRLATWVTDPANRAFSRAVVNRVWALMFGRGLVEPVDDLPIGPRGALAGAVPAELDILADDFAAHGFDLRRLIRTIAATQAFARRSRRRASEDDRWEARAAVFAEFPLTRLRPEQVVGAVLQSANLTTIDHDSHVVVQLARHLQEREFVRRYGDAGEDELEADVGTVPQRLLMLNGELVHRRIKDDLVGNAATRIAVLAEDDSSAVEAAYLAVLTRLPTPGEEAHFVARLQGTTGKARRAALSDLYWALLNSTELAWNH